MARVTWAGTAWKLALIDLVDGHGRPGGSDVFGRTWFSSCSMVVGRYLLPFAVCWWDIVTALAVRCMVGRLVLGTLSAWVRAGEVYFYGKLFGGTRPVVVGGVKRFWDHNRYHISGFWPRNRYHVVCPGH